MEITGNKCYTETQQVVQETLDSSKEIYRRKEQEINANKGKHPKDAGASVVAVPSGTGKKPTVSTGANSSPGSPSSIKQYDCSISHIGETMCCLLSHWNATAASSAMWSRLRNASYSAMIASTGRRMQGNNYTAECNRMEGTQ